jgi:hypothetical protein
MNALTNRRQLLLGTLTAGAGATWRPFRRSPRQRSRIRSLP